MGATMVLASRRSWVALHRRWRGRYVCAMWSVPFVERDLPDITPADQWAFPTQAKFGRLWRESHRFARAGSTHTRRFVSHQHKPLFERRRATSVFVCTLAIRQPNGAAYFDLVVDVTGQGHTSLRQRKSRLGTVAGITSGSSFSAMTFTTPSCRSSRPRTNNAGAERASVRNRIQHPFDTTTLMRPSSSSRSMNMVP